MSEANFESSSHRLPSSLSPEQRLLNAGLSLPPPLKTTHFFKPVSRDGQLAFVSGHVPKQGIQVLHPGRVGKDIDLTLAEELARQTALSCLASLKEEIGDLSLVRRVLKVVGFFATEPGFSDHSTVLNAASKVLMTAFGPAGEHARSAIGVASLPQGAALEIEMVVALHDH